MKINLKNKRENRLKILPTFLTCLFLSQIPSPSHYYLPPLVVSTSLDPIPPDFSFPYPNSSFVYLILSVYLKIKVHRRDSKKYPHSFEKHGEV